MNRSAATLVADAVASFRGHGWQALQVAGDAAEARDRLLAVVGSMESPRGGEGVSRVAGNRCATASCGRRSTRAVRARNPCTQPRRPSGRGCGRNRRYCTGGGAATALIGADDAYAQLVSNLPFSHVVLAHTHAIVPTLGRAWVWCAISLKEYWDGLCLAVGAVSGASRTGDIEMVIVEGMHGPGRVHLILLDFPAPGWEALPPEATTGVESAQSPPPRGVSLPRRPWCRDWCGHNRGGTGSPVGPSLGASPTPRPIGLRV